MTVETLKVNITSLKKNKDEILGLLQNKGIVDIVEKEEAELQDEPKIEKLEHRAAETKSAIDFLKRKVDKGGGMLSSLIPEKIEIKKRKFKDIADDFNGEKITKEVIDLEEKLNRTTNNLDEKSDQLEGLGKWKNLELTKEQLRDLKRTKVLLGKYPKAKLEELLMAIKKELEEIVILKGGEGARMVYLAFVYPESESEKVERILENEDVEKETLDLSKSPKKQYLSLQSEVQKLKKKKEDIEKKIKEFSNSTEKLKVYHDWLLSRLEKKKTEKHLSQSKKTFTITGWVREDQLEELRKALMDFTEEVAITEAKMEEGESPPVVINNKAPFQYYEMITKLYGMPRSTEPDPTVYLAPFFTAFFAVAITDAGYGIIMMLLSFVLLRFTDLPGKRLFKILFWAGLFTLTIGAFFGGWFGVSAPDLPAGLGPIKTALNKIMWMDPVQNPIQMLLFTFFLGVVQIIAGIAVATHWKISQGKLKEGLMDHASWFVLLGAIFVWAATKFGYLALSSSLVRYGLIGATLVFLWCQGRGQKNPLKRMFVGMGGLYDLLGYVSDILSY